MAEVFGPEQVRAMLDEANTPETGLGDGTLFGEPVLVFARLATAGSEGFRQVWARPDGRVVAWANEKDIGPMPSADEASWREMVDHQKTDVAMVTDRDGTRLFEVRHVKHWKSRVTVVDVGGREIGAVRQKNITFKPSWELSGYDRSYGRVRADGSRALAFELTDASGSVYGRMTKVGSPRYLSRTYHAGMAAGLPPATVSTLNQFVLQFHRAPDHPQLAAILPLAIDLSMAGVNLSKLH